MFLPKTAQESGQNTALVLAVQIALLVIGIILTLASYFRKS
jgi:LPXTG-motif cell wall-anchored protein